MEQARIQRLQVTSSQHANTNRGPCSTRDHVLTTSPVMRRKAPKQCGTVTGLSGNNTKLKSRVIAFLAVVVIADINAPNRFVSAATKLTPKKPAPANTITAKMHPMPWDHRGGSLANEGRWQPMAADGTEQGVTNDTLYVACHKFARV